MIYELGAQECLREWGQSKVQVKSHLGKNKYNLGKKPSYMDG